VSSRKRLIVNADDFGRTPGVNRGVSEAQRRGIVTSASLMVQQPAAAEAAAMVKDLPALGVGLHFTLTGAAPLSPPSAIGSIVDTNGKLPSGIEGLLGANPQQVLLELRAQLKRFRELLKADPTHLDSHHAVHQLPTILEAVVTLAWETGLPVRSVTPEMRERFVRERVPTPDHFVGDFFDEGATLENLIRILGSLPLGTSELMCHPAVVDEALKAGSSYAEPRGRELSLLTHTEVRQVIQATGIKLVHYGALAG
jgi:predicted glycoside hydrolase/deacetylase ChbG (UPF0249 family)